MAAATVPTLLSFDIFGTVVDWRRGMRQSLAVSKLGLSDAEFDAVIDHQSGLEQGPFRSYAALTADSLVNVLGLDAAAAAAIGARVGQWPLYPDACEALSRLLAMAPCIAMTNSDRVHRAQVEEQLGLGLTHWFSAEEVGSYKPNVAFWHEVARRLGRGFGRDWWHVSAYGDYDLGTARRLGLTTVLVRRPHARPGPADHTIADLLALARLAAACSSNGGCGS